MKVPELPAVELGEPWRLGDDLQGVGVPILIRTTPNQRGYKLSTEEGAKFQLTDTGNINKLKIHNQSDEHLFFRKGTIVKGGSQTRAFQISALIEPHAKAAMADIRCVYASKGIRAGASMKVSGNLTPYSVSRNLRKGQSATWGSAKSYAMSALSSSRTSVGGDTVGFFMDAGVRMDDLDTVLTKDSKRIEDALKNIPADHIRQIGLVVVDLGGVKGLELFDHPASWGAFSDSIVKSYQEILMNAMPELYDINIDKVKEYVFAFLQNLAVAEADESYPGTWEIANDKIEGEFTMLDDVVIHILAGKKEKGIKSKKRPQRRIPPRRTPPFNPFTVIGPDATQRWTHPNHPIPQMNGQLRSAHIVNHVTKKRGFETMSALIAGPRTYSEVEEDTGMSSRTVSRGLKDGEELGLVEKIIRENGRTAYKLTALGKSTNPKKFKAAYE